MTLPYKGKKRTDYKQRLGLLKSRKLRLVVRKSLNNILLQIIKYEDDGDKILVSAHSTILKKYGWKFHKGNIPAAYLTGLVLGNEAKKKEINDAILDLGLNRSIKGSVQYAALKGVLDSGIEIKHGKDIFPKEDRLNGKSINEEVNKNFQEVKGKIGGEK